MNELKLLGEREEELLTKTRITEAVLKARQENAKPALFSQAQMKLQTLEKMIEENDWLKDPGLEAQVKTLVRPGLFDDQKEASSSGGELDLTRVRINPNVIFSWSYKRLP
jgi:hypothetical protein